tara:strand:- start:463 stop:888 length:426 start_codon:yes stop_codon:yes gene_type:complete
MRIFISLAIFLVLALSFANAQTTLSNITVNGQAYDITYRTDVDFATYETTIDDAPWWQSSAKAFADAANVNNLRFAYDTLTIGGTDYVLYMDSSNASTQSASYASSSDYAISAVAVPAPLPILGILPVVGFLKRMRKRQRA